MNLGTAPITVPTDNVPQPVVPGQQVSAAEPAWKSGQQVALGSPIVAVTPPTIVTVSASVPDWSGPAVTLDPPRPAGTYISRAVSDAEIWPVSYTVSAAKPPLATVRASIQRACADRGRDLELVPQGPANLIVRLKVRQSADAEYLANVIARLPELGPYKVLFEMQVAR